jgi:predicted TIM-barrel fold metal-dependent hydrolase
MDSLNVRHAVFIGSAAQLTALPDSSPGRLLPGLMFPCENGRMPNAGVQCFVNPGDVFPDTGWLRAEARAGRIRVFAELGPQYLGIAPNDTRLEPFYALAEELDLPVGIHLGIGPPGVSYSTTRAPALKSPSYRGVAGDPYLLEDVLLRHPKLRLYVMHAAWPNIEHMLYVLYMHPQVYVDISVLQYAIPHEAYMSALKALVDAGFADRIMFGSDGGPARLASGIEAIEQAPFLSPKQKRDILYDNAMRFFRISDSAPAK